jgi:hypothetical protein
MVMMRRMSETVAPSKKGVIRTLKKSEHSSIYDQELADLYESVIRIDIPHEYSQRMGFGHDKHFVRLYQVNGEIWMSTNRLSFPTHIAKTEMIVSAYWNKYNGSSRSDKLHTMIDEIFIIVPKNILPFDVGDVVTFEYVREEPEGHERHLVMKHAED